MARRRYISTNISTDPKVNILAEKYGDFAALLYTWMIPHVEDNATLTGDPDELMYKVVPALRSKTREDVINALEAMVTLKLIIWDKDKRIIHFPADNFYKYQTYVKHENRINKNEQPESAKNASNSVNISSEEIGVVRGQFLKMFDAVSKRETQNRHLPIGLRDMIQGIAAGMSINALSDGNSPQKTNNPLWEKEEL